MRPTAAQPTPATNWPPRYDLFGARVSATTYADLEALILRAARAHENAVVTHLPVHGIVTAARDPRFRAAVNAFDVVAPDGQPVRWALNHLHGTRLADRVYGPELMLRLCARAAVERIPIYLFGSTPGVLTALAGNLQSRCPGLTIAGQESPPFRELSDAETADVVARINASGAGLVFFGLGCPRQDFFAARTRGRLRAAVLCVGAAFDFHAGTKPMAPAWMQKRGLEWLFRLASEPGRLWRRYLFTNTAFVILFLRHLLTTRVRRMMTPNPIDAAPPAPGVQSV
jgi:exopolysaccharide biosynthesis WecB/TagA/CpsF family protein